MKLKVGSRMSRLAIRQAELIIEELKTVNPALECELVTMKTTGDRILNKTLDKIGGKGLFMKELEAALQEGKIDLAVHSLKDMPMEETKEYPILAFSEREDPRDVLVLPKGVEKWDVKKPVGCSSLRRKIQLHAMYPELEIASVRGNVLTRLEKLDKGEFGALVLAAAGLKRLGLENRISRYFEVTEILPSAGQGVLAVQGKKSLKSITDGIDHKESRWISVAERSFVRRLNGGCSSPVAAYGEIRNGICTLRGLYYNEETGFFKVGQQSLPKEEMADVQNAVRIGMDLAEKLKNEETEK